MHQHQLPIVATKDLNKLVQQKCLHCPQIFNVIVTGNRDPNYKPPKPKRK